MPWMASGPWHRYYLAIGAGAEELEGPAWRPGDARSMASVGYLLELLLASCCDSVLLAVCICVTRPSIAVNCLV